MAGANIFVIYASASGSNVTLSPRLGTGHQEPEENDGAQVSLLEGSGIANGKMVANVRCTYASSSSYFLFSFLSLSYSATTHVLTSFFQNLRLQLRQMVRRQHDFYL